jgi:outer membrane protein assembly factor BamB
MSSPKLLALAAALLLACSVPTQSPQSTASAADASSDSGEDQPQPPQDPNDWPSFLGPHKNGTTTQENLLLEWPEEGPKKLWERPVGEGYGAPVAARGRVIMFHRLGDEEVTECIDANDGSKVYWTHKYGTGYRDRYGYNGGPRSSPAIYGDAVYTYGAEGKLTALDFETGERRWQRNISKDFRIEQAFFGVGTAPVLEGNLILLNVGGTNGAGVVAFHKDTGKTVWKSTDDSPSYSTPIVETINDQRLAIFHTDNGLLVLDPKDGTEKYRYPFRSRIRESAIAATPVLVDDTVFLSAAYGVGAVTLQLAPEGLKEVWENRDAMQSHWATSIYHEGYLYGMDGRHERGSNFRCIKFDTGEIMWTSQDGLGRASFIKAQGHLIAVGERGDVALIELTPEGYKEKERVRVLKYPVWTPPILAQGLLFLRDETSLRCFDLRGEPGDDA